MPKRIQKVLQEKVTLAAGLETRTPKAKMRRMTGQIPVGRNITERGSVQVFVHEMAGVERVTDNIASGKETGKEVRWRTDGYF